MSQDFYARLREDLRDLFKNLKPFHPARIRTVQHQMDKILATASFIGGPIQKDAEQLQRDVIKFLERPSDPNFIKILQNHALRLELETREL
ncbi:MAG: hypothetical protein V4487_03305 [Chlamydiota bacterium]